MACQGCGPAMIQRHRERQSSILQLQNISDMSYIEIIDGFYKLRIEQEFYHANDNASLLNFLYLEKPAFLEEANEKISITMDIYAKVTEKKKNNLKNKFYRNEV